MVGAGAGATQCQGRHHRWYPCHPSRYLQWMERAQVQERVSAAQLEECRAGCIRVVRRILAVDPIGGGNGHPSYFHGTHRYSITGEGAVTAHMGATREFVQLADSPVLHAVLREVYGSDDWFVNGFGGDFCLPGAIAFQPLHSDQVMCCAQPRPSQWLPV